MYISLRFAHVTMSICTDPDNLIWETETDTTSGTDSEEERQEEIKKKNTLITSLGRVPWLMYGQTTPRIYFFFFFA